jgi:histidyl-tRNA synthetase
MALSKQPYKGTRDFFPAQMRVRNFIFQKMAEVSELYAYEPYDGPMLEEVELYLAKSGEELINEQIYSFKDRGDRFVAIRPELTPTVARMVSQIHREVAKPLRWYSIPNLMRYEKMQKARLREFWQYNADIFGAGEDGDFEILQLVISIYEGFGANQEHFEILINDRRLVDFVFKELLQLSPEANQKLYKLMDKKNKMPAEKFSAEVHNITQDPQKTQVFEDYSNLKTGADIHAFVLKYRPAIDVINFEAVAPLLRLINKISDFKLMEYIKFDSSIVRGLDYYTGMVFEVFDKHPDNRRALAGGGSYANLLQIFNEPPLAGVGVGMGEPGLTEFLKGHNLLKDFTKQELDVMVTYQVHEAEKAALHLAQNLREAGIRTETMFGESKVKKVFTHSDRKNVRFVAFMGSDEVSKGEVQIRDLDAKEARNFALTDMIGIISKVKGN